MTTTTTHDKAPDSCPRFGSECSGCGAWVRSGDGAYLLDGGETYCDECIEWVDEAGWSLS